MTEDRDKWRKYGHGVANLRTEDGKKNRTEQCRRLASSDMLEYAAPKLPDPGPPLNTASKNPTLVHIIKTEHRSNCVLFNYFTAEAVTAATDAATVTNQLLIVTTKDSGLYGLDLFIRFCRTHRCVPAH